VLYHGLSGLRSVVWEWGTAARQETQVAVGLLQLRSVTFAYGAGVLLVFIISLGYYITPALVGGPKDQMLSFFIALNTNVTVNWGLAAALSVVLLAVVMVFFTLYNRLVGIDNLKLN